MDKSFSSKIKRSGVFCFILFIFFISNWLWSNSHGSAEGNSAINGSAFGGLVPCPLPLAAYEKHNYFEKSSTEATFLFAGVEEILQKRAGLENSGFTSLEILQKRFSRLGFFLVENSFPSAYGGKGDTQTNPFLPLLEKNQRGALPFDLLDFQVNQENYPSTFEQILPSAVIFKNNSFLTVWEDERNGDKDIYGQKLDSSAISLGNNLKIVSDSASGGLYQDQLFPSLARIGDSTLVLVWINGSKLSLYAQIFSPDLSPIIPPIKVVENGTAQTIWSPNVTAFPDSSFIVVWLDTQTGNNIYGQRFSFSGAPVGSSFKVNDSQIGIRLSPSVAAKSDGSFVITWEDYRSIDADIYFQRYNSFGTSIGPNMVANTDLAFEDQYQPGITFGKNGDFMIVWVNTRSNNEDIYARWFNQSGAPLKPDMQVNTDPGSAPQWDPTIDSDSLGFYIVAWGDYRDEPAIYDQRYDTTATRQGPNFKISDPGVLGNKQKVSLSVKRDGNYVVCWEDKRNASADIYCQRVSSTRILKGTNIKLNRDSLGAVQKTPALATDLSGNFIISWEDFRNGQSNIYVKKFNPYGQQQFDDLKVNDNLVLAPQEFPDVSMDSTGNFLVVWQDQRNGLNIYGQLFYSSGNSQNTNFLVNGSSLSLCQTPHGAKAPGGNFVVVWSAEQSGIRNIYAQRFSKEGSLSGSMLKVNSDIQNVSHIYPKVGMDKKSKFLVAWYDERNSLKKIYTQRYDSSGTQIGSNLFLNADSTDPAKKDFDLGMNQNGKFVLAWVNASSKSKIYAQIFDSSGTPIGTNILVTNDTNSFPEEVKVWIDSDSFFVVAWTDYREGNPNIYYQIFHHNGSYKDVNTRLNQQSLAIQKYADISLNRGFILSAWMDNRMAGHGFDIYANKVTYRTTDIGGEEEGSEKLPLTFELYQNYPNPFNPTTTIPFTVYGSRFIVDSPIRTTLRIYNIRGQLVKTLLNENKLPGEYKIIWDGKDDKGNEVSSGVYFYQLKAGEQKKIHKMLLIK